MAGCSGGFPWSVYKYLQTSGGQESETTYPYKGVNGTCAFEPSSTTVPAPKSWQFITTTHDEDAMAEFMATKGPLSIAVDASYFQFYKKGVANPLFCSKTELDHAVALVGYGVEETKFYPQGEDYWILRNSWSTAWGIDGYMKIKKGQNTCGLSDTASAPFY